MTVAANDVRPMAIPWLVSSTGVLISVGFMVAAGVMNWRYGLGLGRSEQDQMLFAGIAAGIDIMKVLLPFFFWWSLKNRRWISFALSGILIPALMSYSIAGIAGFVDLNRAQTTGSVLGKQETITDLREKLTRKSQQLAAIGLFEPPTVVEEKILAGRQNRYWSTSEQCNNATTKDSRAFCADYHALEAQKAKGLEAATLERELVQLRDAITALAGVSEIDRGDPRAGFVARTTGWELLKVQTWLSLLQVGIIEVMSTFGIFLSLNHGALRKTAARADAYQPRWNRPTGETAARMEVVGSESRSLASASKPLVLAAPESNLQSLIGHVVKFAVECLRPTPGSRVALAELYPHYRAWCEKNGSRQAGASEFESMFLAMCESTGFLIRREEDAVYCLELGLAD